MKKNECKWLCRSLVVGPYYCLCVSEKDYNKRLDEIKIPQNKRDKFITVSGKGAQVHHYNNSKGESVCIVTIDSYKDHSICEVFALIAHEAVHIYQEAIRNMQEREASAELEAYSIQHICLELFDSFCMQTKDKGIVCGLKEKKKK